MGEGAVAMEAEREKDDDGSRGPSDVATSQGGWQPLEAGEGK